MKGIKENSWVAWALQIFITEGLCALETPYYSFLLWSGAMLCTHRCAQGHDLTYIFINPKYQAEICNKTFNVSSLIIREEPALWVLTLFSVCGRGQKEIKGRTCSRIYLFLCSRDSFSVFPAKVLYFFAWHMIIAGGLCGFWEEQKLKCKLVWCI